VQKNLVLVVLIRLTRECRLHDIRILRYASDATLRCHHVAAAMRMMGNIACTSAGENLRKKRD
jgi:hypothetical protein